MITKIGCDQNFGCSPQLFREGFSVIISWPK